MRGSGRVTDPKLGPHHIFPTPRKEIAERLTLVQSLLSSSLLNLSSPGIHGFDPTGR